MVSTSKGPNVPKADRYVSKEQTRLTLGRSEIMSKYERKILISLS